MFLQYFLYRLAKLHIWLDSSVGESNPHRYIPNALVT